MRSSDINRIAAGIKLQPSRLAGRDIGATFVDLPLRVAALRDRFTLVREGDLFAGL